MKQKNKSLALIALVLVVAALGAALVFLNGLEEEEDPGLPLFGLDAADITGISYQKADDEIDVTLLKQDGAWTLTSDPALPLDQDYVGTVGGNIAGLTAVRELDPGELSGEDLGFDQPAMVLHLALNGADPAATGESAADVYTLTIGAETPSPTLAMPRPAGPTAFTRSRRRTLSTSAVPRASSMRSRRSPAWKKTTSRP